MKVADLFGAGVPVCALDYGACLAERVRHGDNGLLFSTGRQLARRAVRPVRNVPGGPVDARSSARGSPALGAPDVGRRLDPRRQTGPAAADRISSAWSTLTRLYDRAVADRPSAEEIATWQKRFAVACNNRAWALIEQPQRTPAETHEMLHAAHAAAWHWAAWAPS